MLFFPSILVALVSSQYFVDPIINQEDTQSAADSMRRFTEFIDQLNYPNSSFEMANTLTAHMSTLQTNNDYENLSLVGYSLINHLDVIATSTPPNTENVLVDDGDGSFALTE